MIGDVHQYSQEDFECENGRQEMKMMEYAIAHSLDREMKGCVGGHFESCAFVRVHRENERSATRCASTKSTTTIIKLTSRDNKRPDPPDATHQNMTRKKIHHSPQRKFPQKIKHGPHRDRRQTKQKKERAQRPPSVPHLPRNDPRQLQTKRHVFHHLQPHPIDEFGRERQHRLRRGRGEEKHAQSQRLLSRHGKFRRGRSGAPFDGEIGGSEGNADHEV